MREQAEVKVILRYALWNIGDVLNPVGKNKRIMKSQYPTEELTLPLLNFDTFAMRAYPPEIYEEDCKIPKFYSKIMSSKILFSSEQTTRKCKN